MEVQVRHRLARVLAAVGDNAVSVFDTGLFGKLPNLCENVGDNLAVLGIDRIDTLDVLLWNHQKVHRRDGRNVVERQNLVVLVQFVGWDFAVDDFTEQNNW